MRIVLPLLVVLLAGSACRGTTATSTDPGRGGSGGEGQGGGGEGGETDFTEDIGVPEPVQRWPELEPVLPGPREQRGELCRPDGWCWTTPIPTADPLVTGTQTPERVWLAGPGELLDFDGSTWRSSAWSADMAPLALDAGAEDDVWMAADALVAHFDGTHWRRWVAPEGSPVLDVAAVGDGVAWLQMGGGRPHLVRASVEGFQPVRMRGVRPSGGLAAAGDVVIAGTDSGVIAYYDGAWHRDTQGNFPVLDVCVAGGGQLLMAADSLWRREGPGRWVELALTRLRELQCGGTIVGSENGDMRHVNLGMIDDLPYASVPLVEADGTIWSDGRYGPSGWSPGLWRGEERMDRGPSVRSLAEADDGTVWGADVEVAHFEGGWVTSFAGDAGLRVRQLAVSASVYGAVADGVVRYAGTVERSLEAAAPVIGAGEGVAFAADERGDVFREDGTVWRPLDPLAPALPLGLSVLSPESIELGRYEAPFTVLRRWDGATWSELGRIEGAFGGRVTQGDGGEAWVGTARYSGGEVTPVLFPEPPVRVTSVAPVGDEVWAVVDGQVLRQVDGVWEHEHAVGARKLEVSPRGEVWVLGTAGALYRWDGARLVLVPTGVSTDLNGVWFEGAQMLVAGNNGVLLSGNAAGFTRVETGTRADLLAVVDVGSEIFLGTSSSGGGSGLYRLRDGRVEAQVGAVTVHEFVFVPPDEIWAAAEPYALRFDEDGRWRQYGMPAQAIAGVAGNMWMGFEHQIGHWTGALSSRGPLLGTTDHSSYVLDVSMDSRGQVWVAGLFSNGTGLVRGSKGVWNTEGVSVFPPGGIAATAGRGTTQFVVNAQALYRVTEGRAEIAAEVLRSPRDLLVDRDGRLWMTVTGRGPGRTQGAFYAAMRRAR